MNNGFPYVAQITCCVLCIQTKFDLHLDASFTYKKYKDRRSPLLTNPEHFVFETL